MTKLSVVVFFVFFLAAPVFAVALVNINTADSTTLQTLNGIGPSKAQAIIDYRTQSGLFAVIEDIMNVSGIGTATFNNIKASITVSDASASSNDIATSTSTTTVTSTTNSSPPPAPVSSYVAPPMPQVFADAGGDRTVIVGADTQFNGRAYNRQKENVEHVRFMWNFGDGSTAEGPIVSHHYSYPGRYAVMLTIAQNIDAVSDRVVVTAEPAKLAFALLPDGGVAIENHAGRDLDLSGWIIRSFGQMFTLPEHSIILNGETMRLSQKTLKFFGGPQSELEYPNGVVALHANESSVNASQSAPAPVQAPPPQAVAARVVASPRSADSSVSSIAPSMPVAESPESTEESATSSQVAAAAQADLPAQTGGTYWWLGALGLGSLAAGAVFAVRRVKTGEWEITEET